MEKQAVLDTIDKLLIVQERDNQLAAWRRELESLPVRRKEIEDQIAAARQALEEARNRIASHQASVKKWELEIETGRQQILKLKEQQFQIKTNEEYRTLGREITHLADHKNGLEERAIEAMEQVEQVKTEAADRKEKLDRESARIQEQLSRLEERRVQIERDVGGLQAERDRLAEGIDPVWLARYNHVMDHKKDKALAAVVKSACGQCHMTLPPQVIHDTRRSEGIVTCSFCGRILYWTT